MIIDNLIVGPFAVNTYLVYGRPGGDAVIIDPGADPEEILSTVAEKRLNVTHILNTHGHGDHIGANAFVKQIFPRAKICIHHRDAHMLTDSDANFSAAFGFEITSPPADVLLEGDTRITAAGISIRVEHVPGHTPGSVCFIPEDGPSSVFTGDTLMAGTIGRTDLAGGNGGLLLSSIADKILTLPDETAVYPGHGMATTVGAEKRNNSFISSNPDARGPYNSDAV